MLFFSLDPPNYSMVAIEAVFLYKYLKFRSIFNIMIITCLQKLKIDNRLIISDLKNSFKIVFVPNNFCAIRCKISILK